MQFTTAEERESYFDRMEETEWEPEYGSAMEHASTVRLGLWGDSAALMGDCATIFCGELRRFCAENGIRNRESFFSKRLLTQRSDTFRRAFRAARVVVDGKAHNDLAGIIEALQPDARTELNDDERESLIDLHEKVLREFHIFIPDRRERISTCPQTT